MGKTRKQAVEHHPDVAALIAAARAADASTSAPRQHHLVPASYLERWAEGDRIRVTEAESRRSYTTRPAKACRERDYYRLVADEVDADEVPPLLFEALLGRIEGRAASAIDRLLRDNLTEVAPEDAAVLATFIAFSGPAAKSSGGGNASSRPRSSGFTTAT